MTELTAPSGGHRPSHRILATKLVPPGLPFGLVQRPRLQQELTRGSERLLTLVSAQPGAGKTVLVAEWARSGEAPGPVAWVTVDADDDLPGRFWASVEIALEHACSNGEPGTLSDFAGQLGDPVPGRGADTVDRIANTVARRREPIVLVLDDFQELSSSVVIGQLTHLIRHAPPQLRVVLCTRADPALPLQWLRLSGNLLEIRAAGLAFTPVEARALLGPFAEDLTDHVIERLCARTEGWAAGVGLAALSLADHEDPEAFLERFAGDDRAVADYLLSEILNRQDEETRSFLLRTSTPDRLTGDLARALTGREDAEAVLSDLVGENLLLSRIDGPAVFYRYHGLFLEFLRAELSRRRGAELPDLHRRAARWYGGTGEPLLALRHALAGADWPFAAKLVAESWHTLVLADSGASARGLAEQLAPESLESHASLALLAATSLFTRGEASEAHRCLARAERLLADDPDPSVTAFLEFVRLAAVRLTGDPSAVAAHARTLIDAPPPMLAGSARWFRTERAIGLAALGSAEFWAGEYDSAEEHLDAALELAREEAIGLTVLECMGHQALRDFATGHLRRAADVGSRAVELAVARGLPDTREAVAAHIALGATYHHWDELDRAREHLERAAAVAQQAGDQTGHASAIATLAVVLAAMSADGADHGLRLLRASLAATDGWTPPPPLAEGLAALPARLLAMKGDYDGAWAALNRATTDAEASPQLQVVRARVLLSTGDPWQAAAVLKPLLDQAGDSPYYSMYVEANLLEAIARHETREREHASASLERTLDLAAPNRFRRLFVGAGPVMRTMLQEHARRGTRQRAFVGELLAAFERRAPQVDLTQVQLLEPLSAREQAILRYLPTLMSNQEIAGELFVSVNTVKTHLRSIYRKLGATRRREAVESARRLELL